MSGLNSTLRLPKAAGCLSNNYYGFSIATSPDKCDRPSLRKGDLEAIYVPTRRATSYFLANIDILAKHADHIWVLATGEAADTWQQLSSRPPNVIRLCPCDVNQSHQRLLALSSSNNPSKSIICDYDLPAKRNQALYHARREGFTRICLLDDDIRLDAQQIATAIWHLRQGIPLETISKR